MSKNSIPATADHRFEGVSSPTLQINN